MKLIEWICVVMSICILLFFTVCLTTRPDVGSYIQNNKSIKWIKMEDVESTLNNCDLIFFSGKTLGENMCKWLGDCIFSHIGIISKEGGKVYVVECDLGQGHRDGVRVILLEDKLSRYRGDRVACIKKLYGGTIDIENMNNIVPNYLEVEFCNSILNWLFADYTAPKENKKMFCSEFVSVILQKLKIVRSHNEKGKVPYWYTPGDYFKNKVALHSPYFYGENIFFRF